MWMSWQTWYIIRQPEKAVCPYLVGVKQSATSTSRVSYTNQAGSNTTTIIKYTLSMRGKRTGT